MLFLALFCVLKSMEPLSFDSPLETNVFRVPYDGNGFYVLPAWESDPRTRTANIHSIHVCICVSVCVFARSRVRLGVYERECE